MPQRTRRLTAQGIERVMRKGARYAGASFFIRVLPGAEGTSRMGVVVGRKVAKKAVRRNYYKRVLRHTLRTLLNGSERAWDVAVVANPAIAEQPFAELEKELRAAAHEAGILGEKR